MKKITAVIAVILLIPLLSKSQIVITSDEILGIGDEVIQAYDNSPDPSLIPGNPGENLFWDFSALFADDIDTFSFVSPTTTPYGSTFPSSNLALFTGEEGSYVYFDKNTDALLMVGLVTEMEDLGVVSSPVEPNEEFLVFPFEYGYQGNETFTYNFTADVSIPGIDSMKMKRTIDKESEVDAWGTMTVPMGTYDVLRIHETRDYTDTIWAKVAIFGWQVFSIEEGQEERYIWCSDDPEVRYILANLNIDPGTGEVTDGEFMAEPQPVGLHEIYARADLKVYPNPFLGRITVRNADARPLDYLLTDAGGKILIKERIKASEINILRLEYLVPGIYFLRYYSEDRTSTIKVIKK